MPLNAIDYSKSVIYTIIHKDNNTLNYVGSTTSFKDRLGSHKLHSISHTSKSCYKLYTMIRDNGGWDSFIMKPYKLFPCNNKIELLIEEEKCRLELNATLNSRKCYTNKEERLEQTKKYYLENKKSLNEQHKKCYEENKEERSKQIKNYQIENEEHLKQTAIKYYEENKEKINNHRKQKIICECGCEVLLGNISHHKKTKKHLGLLSK